jgi:hypothetical protein
MSGNESTETYYKPKATITIQDVKLLVKKEIDEHTKQSTIKQDALKIALAVVPLCVSFFVWISALQSRVVVLETKSDTITEIKSELKKLNEEIVKLRIEIGKSK